MRFHTLLPLVPCLVLALGSPTSASESEPRVLAEVNGQPITSADLERLIVKEHQGGAMSEDDAEGMVPRLLEKAIRDELILQDAFAMGMGEDPAITEPIRLATIRQAVALYARDEIDVPPVTDAQVQQFFQDYYHRIQIRQLSLSTPEECDDALLRIKSGEVTMGALAVEKSLDTKKPRGGLHNDIHWADLEVPLREAAEHLQPGEFSAPFPYGAVWSIIRVESRTPPDPSELPRFESFIRGALDAEARQEGWQRFVRERRGQVELHRNAEVLERVKADAAVLYRGEFKYGSEDPILWIDTEHAITEQRFREEMSSLAMGMGDQEFSSVLDAALADQEEFLVMWWFADRDGWLQNPQVQEFYESELERAVLETYLSENIGQKVRFDRDEYDRFYREHQEDFRGAEQVRLSILTADDEDTILDAAERLSEGADFEFVRAEVEGRDPGSESATRWGAITSFNATIVDALADLEVGETSAPIPFSRKWMIIRLDGRREGEVPPIEEVDETIRKALYFQEFSSLLDQHLERLRSASEIVRHEDQIRAWAAGES